MKKIVIKKNGSQMPWDFTKIISAVNKAAVRCGVILSDKDFQEFKTDIEFELRDLKEIEVERIHAAVENNLDKISSTVARAYKDYRNYKKNFSSVWEHIYKQSHDALYLGDRENANFDSSLNSTKGSLIRGYLTKELFKQYEMKTDEIQAIESGYIYAHDLTNLLFRQINCCLFDIGNLLKDGFEMANTEYLEPKSVLSALQVIGDVALVSTAQQFGGWTAPEIDSVLIKYAKKSIAIAKAEAEKYGIRDVDAYVQDKLWAELVQGFQSIEMKLNTVPCSRGDFAFTTMSFGNVKDSEDPDLQRVIAKAILYVRAKGQGKHGRPVVFPKLVYLYSEEQHQDIEQQRLFHEAVKCSSKAMYPDYLAIDTVGDVSRIFKKHGVVTSPMGCRAFLSEYQDPVTGKGITTGRANIGAVSLNLPMIYMKAKTEGQDFYQVLDTYLDMVRQFLNRRYEYISKATASTNPLAFTQGGLLGGNLKPHEQIGDLVNSFTASFGITALNELNVLMTGMPLDKSQDNSAVKQVVDHINNYIKKARAEDHRLYALYGTPAESLCGTQLRQFRAIYGEIPGVSDRLYFTNSFHMHVSADIDPFTKQDLEHQLFHEIPGGHIVYNRIRGRYNLQAMKSIILRGMALGLYQGVNYDLAMCNECGWEGEDDVDFCPVCESRRITTIVRNCGYLSFSKTEGGTRLNDAKLAEVTDRISM